MPSIPAAALPSDLSASHDLLHALLDVSLPGIILFRPVYAADAPATIIDLAYVHLNPAAQQMLRLPAQPPDTFRTLYPNSQETGIFAFYRDTFLSGQPNEYAVNYPYDGLNNFFLLSARRSGELLVVDFTDTAAQERSQVEQALRESQAREQAARAEAEAQRQRFYDVLMQLPAQVATYHGPDHVFTFVNQRFSAFVPSLDLLGRPVREAARGAVGQEVFALLDRVYATGEPLHLPELEVVLDNHNEAPAAEPLFVNATYLPLHDGEGHIYGVLDFSYEVTEQVLARRQVEQLNQELEARVQQRTRELEDQQRLLSQILAQVPAAIATLRGPEHRFTFFNEPYQALIGDRAVLGRPVAEVLPEVEEQGFTALLDQVYATGQPYLGTDTAIMLHGRDTDQAEQRYLDFAYQPLLDGQHRPQGVLAFLLDVTDRVRARKQADTLQAAMLAVVKRQGRERENVYQLFEQAPAAICLLREPNHRIDYLNPAYQALFPSQVLKGHTLAEAQPANQALVTLFDGIYQSGEPQLQAEVPVHISQPDGQAPLTRYFDFTYQAYHEDGRIAGVSIFGFEVTERVLSRQAAEATAQRLRLLTDALPVLIGYLDRDRRYQFTNRAYEAWFNQPADALLGRPVREVVGEKAYQTTSGYMDQALAGERVEFSVRMPYREGFVKHIHTDYIPDVQNGEVLGFYTLVADITEQVTIREELEAQRAELQRIFELAPVAISVYRVASGDEYLIEYVNSPLARIIGQSPAQMLGRSLSDFMPDMRSQGLQAILDGVRQTGEPFVAQELPVTVARNQHHELGYFNFVYQPLPDAQGQLTGVICVATEVTGQVLARQQVQGLNEELTATNEELKDTNTRLTRTNTDLDTFVYTASHDLKAPINNIEGILHALREMLPPDVQEQAEIAHMLGLLHTTVSRFLVTIDQLTDLSRLQQTYNEPAQLLALAPIVAGVVEDLAPAIAAAPVQLHLDVPAGLQVSFAPASLRSVVYNLLSNAVKYRDLVRPAQVWLRAEQQDNTVILTVRDNGLGLSGSQQTRLFGVFQRLHTHVEGTGVGLYMIKRLIENAGASIAVVSMPGVGSTFTVAFPA